MVAKMEWVFYANPNGTLANLHLWFVPTLDTSKLLFLWGILSGHPKRAIKRETNPTGTAPIGLRDANPYKSHRSGAPAVTILDFVLPWAL